MALVCYIVRHGQTEWNVKKIHQGHLDSPLTEEGKKDAEEKGILLQGRGIKIIYSSDLGRCISTAEAINEFLRLRIVSSKELRERDYGEFSGKTKEEIGDFDYWSFDSTAPGGEPLSRMKERLMQFLLSLERRETAPVLIVTHGGPTRLILSEILRKPVADAACKPAQSYVGKFEIENGNLQNFEFVKKE